MENETERKPIHFHKLLVFHTFILLMRTQWLCICFLVAFEAATTFADTLFESINRTQKMMNDNRTMSPTFSSLSFLSSSTQNAKWYDWRWSGGKKKHSEEEKDKNWLTIHNYLSCLFVVSCCAKLQMDEKWFLFVFVLCAHETHMNQFECENDNDLVERKRENMNEATKIINITNDELYKTWK